MIFKKLKKNKNKPSGKKRKLLTTIALILSLLFGKSPSMYLQCLVKHIVAYKINLVLMRT